MAVGPAGILPAREWDQPGATPSCPKGKMPVLRNFLHARYFIGVREIRIRVCKSEPGIRAGSFQRSDRRLRGAGSRGPVERKSVLRSGERLFSNARFWSRDSELRTRTRVGLQPTRVERYLQFAGINQYSIAAAVALWLGIFGIVALILARRRSVARMSLSILCLLVCAAAVWAIHTLDNGSEGRGLAIVTGNDVQARLATADTANSVLALPAGSEIKILSTRGDWMYAALPNDLRGWIQTKNAEQVRL